MKPNKIVRAFLVVMLLVVAVLLGVLFYADRIVQIGVEKVGTTALGVDTTLRSVDLSITSGSLGMQNLKIANPPGFETPEMMNMGELTTAVDMNSVFSDTIRIEKIKIADLQITVEQKGLTSNIQAIMDNIKKNQGPAQPRQKTQEPPKDLSQKKLRVDRIEITDARAWIKLLPLPGQKDVLEVKLAPIVIEGASSDDNQAVMAVAIMQKIVLAVIEGTIKAGGDVLPKDFANGLNASLKDTQKLVGDLGKALQDTGKTIKEGGDALKKTGEGLINILGKPADKSEKPAPPQEQK